MKVGDRVRINFPEGKHHGKEATIWSIAEWRSKTKPRYAIAYRLDVDGVGRYWKNGIDRIAYERHELIPLTKPREALSTWEEAFKGTNFDIRREHETI